MQSSLHHSRRLSTLDVIILIASTVPGLLWLWLTEEYWSGFFADFEGHWFRRLYFSALPITALIADPLLSAWTLAWCLLRFRSPRARWHRLVRQPGVSVGFVAILAWFAGGIVTFRWWTDVHHGTPDWIDLGIVQVTSATMLGGFGVFVTWTGSALDGVWRPEGSWIDQMGRTLGVAWIALGVPSGILLELLTGPFY